MNNDACCVHVPLARSRWQRDKHNGSTAHHCRYLLSRDEGWVEQIQGLATASCNPSCRIVCNTFLTCMRLPGSHAGPMCAECGNGAIQLQPHRAPYRSFPCTDLLRPLRKCCLARELSHEAERHFWIAGLFRACQVSQPSYDCTVRIESTNKI